MGASGSASGSESWPFGPIPSAIPRRHSAGRRAGRLLDARRLARACPGEPLECLLAGSGARRQLAQRAIGAAALPFGDDRGRIVFAQAGHVAQPDPHPEIRLDRALDPACVHIRAPDLDPAPLRLVDQRVGRVEAHRLLVQERAEELRTPVDPKPGGLVGEQPERGRVRLREAEAREAADLLEDPVSDLPVDALRDGSVQEPVAVGVDRLLGALPAHRPPKSLGLARR